MIGQKKVQPEFAAKRILLKKSPFGEVWNAKWIAAEETERPHAALYRNRFSLKDAQKIRIHVSADSVYILYLNGKEIGRGPELGEPHRWCFDSYELDFPDGSHVLSAFVWFFGRTWEFIPYPKMSLRNGFLLAAEGDGASILDTNPQNWECRVPDGITIAHCRAGGVGPETQIDGRCYPSEAELEKDDGWSRPVESEAGRNADPGTEFDPQKHLLIPSRLPEQVHTEIRRAKVLRIDDRTDDFYPGSGNRNAELPLWKQNLEQGAFPVPPDTSRRILLRLDNYYCGYPELICSGGYGSSVSIQWAEALSLSPSRNSREKGDRLSVENRYFHGQGDTLLCGRERVRLIPPWYRAGRYLQITIRTRGEALTVEKLSLRESRYPLEAESSFHCSGERYNRLIVPAVRTLQMCAHDTYMDCPFYEQLMYLADARLEMLLHYVLSAERKLEEKSIRLLAAGKMESGLLQCRYPSQMTLNIPTFTLLFPGMVHDYILYAGDVAVLREILPAMRSALDSVEQYLLPGGLLAWNHLWSFIDWVDEWNVPERRKGSPPMTEDGVSGIVNWLYAYALGEAMRAHELAGEPEEAARFRRLGTRLAEKLIRVFYREREHLFSDLPDSGRFSEHAQCLALLSGFLPEDLEKEVADSLFARTAGMAECTVYFSFYYLEVCGKYDRMDRFDERLKLWFDMQNLNVETFLESPEPSRSDCHAWSAHILWHYYATILGLRPADASFRSLRIEPHPGSLTFARGSLSHPAGMIRFSFQREKDGIQWKLELPGKLTADFRFGTQKIRFRPGLHTFRTAEKLQE